MPQPITQLSSRQEDSYVLRIKKKVVKPNLWWKSDPEGSLIIKVLDKKTGHKHVVVFIVSSHEQVDSTLTSSPALKPAGGTSVTTD